MEFATDAGLVVLVDSAHAGQRLQAFACRSFREELGRGDTSIHANSKLAARVALEAGRMLVNGVAAAGWQDTVAWQLRSTRAVTTTLIGIPI